MELMDIHGTHLKRFCKENGYSFDKLRKLPRCGNESVLFVQVCKESKSKNGLLDETPAEILLSLYLDENGNAEIIKGKNADKYLRP